MSKTVTIYCLDVSEGMTEKVLDPSTDEEVPKIDLAKEYIQRKIAPKVQGGRKTEYAGVITFGGATNNPYFAADTTSHPEAEATDPADYIGVASVIYPQTAAPAMLSVVKGIKTGKNPANPLAALVLAHQEFTDDANKSKGFKREVVVLTHEKAKLKSDNWQTVMNMLYEQEIVVRWIGVGYDSRSTEELMEDKTAFDELPKSERFWRKFIQKMAEVCKDDDDSKQPALGSIDLALSIARGPSINQPDSVLNKSTFRIGSKEINPDEGIEFPVRYSKATSKAMPMSLKKVIASQLLPQNRLHASQHGAGASQSQTQAKIAPKTGSAGIEADVTPFKRYTVMVPKAKDENDDMEVDQVPDATKILNTDDQDAKPEVEYEEREVEEENLVKAYKFGKTWVPMPKDIFPEMETAAGMDVIGFMKASGMRRYQEMGEVRFIWAELDNHNSQIQLSAVVQAMVQKDYVAIVRTVDKANSPPKVGVCKPVIDADQLHYLYWVQMPFAEDERSFFFPSLNNLFSKSGKPITEHPLLPTDNQLLLMDKLVEGMDLDVYEEVEDETEYPWFDPYASSNPAIHRLQEAIFHLATVPDPEENPVGPPHPELVKYLYPPTEVVEETEEVVRELKRELNIKRVPPPVKRTERKSGRANGTADDSEIDIDELFNKPLASGSQSAQPGSTIKPAGFTPKTGRVISNEDPVGDFLREVEHGGDITAKAMQDLAEVSKEIVSTSFSSSNFGKAIDCWQTMREQALLLEESELYNSLRQELETHIKAPNFEHKDFWQHFEKAEPSLGPISQAEAEAALS